MACLTDAQSLSAYTDYLTELTEWSDSSHLLLNVSKTIEMCIDSNNNTLPNPLFKPVMDNYPLITLRLFWIKWTASLVLLTTQSTLHYIHTALFLNIQ